MKPHLIITLIVLGICPVLPYRNATAQGTLHAMDETSPPPIYQQSFSAIEGMAPTVEWGQEKFQCYEYKKFTVLQSSNGEVQTIQVKTSDVKCASLTDKIAQQSDVFQVKGAYMFFYGLRGSLLFIDEGTAPSPRGLGIYNVSKGEKLSGINYSGPLVIETDGNLTFWLETDKANEANCPDFKTMTSGGLGAAIETKASLNLKNFKVSKTKEIRCEVRLLIFDVRSLHAEADPKGTQPEDFDWLEYVDQGGDTAEEMRRAKKGVRILAMRMNSLRTEYRNLLISYDDKEGLQLFDEMQSHWQKASDAEVAFIGNSWAGGSGAKAAYPRALLHSYLFRVKELQSIAEECCALQH